LSGEYMAPRAVPASINAAISHNRRPHSRSLHPFALLSNLSHSIPCHMRREPLSLYLRLIASTLATLMQLTTKSSMIAKCGQCVRHEHATEERSKNQSHEPYQKRKLPSALRNDGGDGVLERGLIDSRANGGTIRPPILLHRRQQNYNPYPGMEL
jgi:hypothetical protein